ncbi:MAG: HAD family hydrolase [Christensenellaceae bacterium]
MKNVAFDLYGTLVDIRTEEWSEAFREAFVSYLVRTLGEGEDFFFRYEAALRAAQGTEEEEVDLLPLFADVLALDRERARLVMRAYRTLSRKKLRTYPQMKELLRELRAQRTGVYLLSNAQSAFTMDELESLGLAECFDGIALSSDYGFKKPSKAFFEGAMRSLGILPQETVYVGNEIRCDLVGSTGVGMRCVYIRSELSPREDTIESALRIAEFATDSHDELKRYLIKITSV